jgi:hypothetical protein
MAQVQSSEALVGGWETPRMIFQSQFAERQMKEVWQGRRLRGQEPTKLHIR